MPLDKIQTRDIAKALDNNENYAEAANYFKLASELGPPAVGMHTYYYGKCLYELGKTEHAIAAF